MYCWTITLDVVERTEEYLKARKEPADKLSHAK
jgi:hypothetical protein